MKRILGLDLGTTSIGWALVNEAEDEKEQSSIIKLGVRVNPLSTDEQTDFEKGKPLSINADRTLKRGARRNLQRFKLRRENLIEALINNDIIKNDTVMTEVGKYTTYQLLELRAKAAREKVEKQDFARILMNINKKRGYKSSRKAKNEEEGNLIDGMAVAKELYELEQTPGQYVFNLLNNNKKYIPEFYQSDLQSELDKIWNFQKQFYTDILTDELYKALIGQGQQNTRKRFLAIKGIYTVENKGSREEVKVQHYKWRAEALKTQLKIEEVAYVIVEINNNLNKSSGYLGAISDRSKVLFFDKLTVGEYLYQQIKENPHTTLKNQVFYRQDYLDEFEQIWETQKKFHQELTNDLKAEIRDIVIFFQRKLKSQKGLISICEFESKIIEINQDGKIKKKEIGPRVIPKSSPLFQEFKIWQNINNLEFENIKTHEKRILGEEDKRALFEEVNLKGNFSKKEVFNFLNIKEKDWEINFKEGIEGNRTNVSLFNVYQKIAELEGYGFDWDKKSAPEIVEELKVIFPAIGIQCEILEFDSNADLDKQASYQLWHLLYSAEDDAKQISEEDQIKYGKSNVTLQKKLHTKFGFKLEYAKMLANISLQQDYGSLSTKAIKKILPHLKDGLEYSEACKMVGYNHSNSLNEKELANRVLKEKLDLLKKNSLRNPVVEKILNQMINLTNQIIDQFGKPDEVRIELARELKNSAKQRAEMTTNINNANKRHDDLKKLLHKEFGIINPTRNDIIKYKLYEELATNGYKTLYTNRQIKPGELFSKEIDIEHIIPKTKLFDDSFSNKTLEFRKSNQDKGNMTAIDYINEFHKDDIENYKSRVEMLYKNTAISKTKYNKLLMEEKNIPKDFIERDLRNSQYIAKKTKEMLEEVVRTVTTTTGSITDELRRDWDLINVMKELNLPKYRALGLTEMEIRKYEQEVEQITDWTKRNDHRHHAMDALTVAFTSYSHVQYLNNLNAASRKDNRFSNLKDKITTIYEAQNGSKKRKFTLPMDNFRSEAKKHIESILISFKTKNKVVTSNINKTKKLGKDQFNKRVQLTPRGQLHKETVYGKILQSIVKQEKISAKFDREKIEQVCNPTFKEALLKRLEENNNDPKKAFAGKNALDKNPIQLANGMKVPEVLKIVCFEELYTIRKDISPDLKIEKVVDLKIQKILQKRLDDYNGDSKSAFANLEKNPIWVNKEKGISIKRVTITGVSNAEALHQKKDHFGNEIRNQDGNTIPTDFVSTGNNHHVAIYKDNEGNLQEKVVSFYEAVARVNEGLEVIDKYFNQHLGWEFQFTMKQNEMFVFSSSDFNPNEMDLRDEKNASLISPHLFRVQKIGKKDYWFRHHLETQINDSKELNEVTYKRKRNPESIKNILKVRINHLGQIVHVGEY